MKTPTHQPDNSQASNPWEDFQQIDETGDIFRQMFKYSIIPTIIHDMEMNIINVNDAALKEFGYSRKELLQKSVFDLHPETELDHSQEVLEIMQHEKTLSVEGRFKRKDGSVFIAEATPCKYILGDKPLIHVFIQDISERKQALNEIRDFNNKLETEVAQRTQELELKNKDLETFSYSVSHDLQAPLRAIGGYAEILRADYSADLNENGKQLIHTIIRNANRMSRLIEDILVISRLSMQEIHLQEINMTELFRSVYADLIQDIGDRKIDFRLDKLKNCRADKTMITQLVSNLLANSIKYTRPKKAARIKVSVYEKNGNCIYAVKDNGIGFNMQYYHKLFGAFERLHDGKEFEGTGIGLSIVQRVVKHHNGMVWAESEVGKGTTFYFTLEPNKPAARR